MAFGVVASSGSSSEVGFDRRLAACAQGGTLVELFFSDQLGDIAQARSICQACPVIEPCLEGALDRREPWGVWGGELFAGGVILANKRRRGRPTKEEAAAYAAAVTAAAAVAVAQPA